MADITKTVEIIFGAKSTIGGTITNIDGQISSLNTSIMTATKPLATIANSVFKLDAALLALAVGGLAYAYDKSVKFETAMVSFRKVSDGTPESLNAAREAAFALSTQYGATAVSVLNSTSDFVMAGYDTQQSLYLTERALQLMMAGEVSVAEASQYMVTILKGFKAPAEEAGRLTDILNKVSDETSTNVRELAIGMAYLSPIAKLMGLSFEETAGLLTPVIEVFSSGSEAAHGLRTGLLRLVDDSKPVGDALEQLGISQTDVNGKLRSGKDILLDVQKAYIGLDEPTKIFLAQQLAGKDQAAKMLEVFNGLNRTLEITAIAMGAAGSIAKEVALRLESSQIQIDRFKVGFENLGIVVGQQFKLAATGAVTGVNTILAAINGLVVSGAFAPLFDELSRMGNDLSKYLVKIAAVLPEAMKGIDFSGLVASFKEVGGEIGDVFANLFGDVDLTTAEGLHKAIQAVIDALAKLVKFTAGMIKGMDPLWQSIKLGIDQFSKMDSQGVTLAGTFIGFGKAVNVLTENAGLLTGALYLLTTKALVETGAALASLGVKALSAVGGMGALSAAAGVAVPVLGVGIAGAAGYAAGSLLNQIPIVQKLGQAFWSLLDVNNDYFGALSKTPEEMAKVDAAFEMAVSGAKKVLSSVGDIPDKKEMSIDSNLAEVFEEIRRFGKQIVTQIPEERNMNVAVEVDGSTIDKAYGVIRKTFPDGTVMITNVGVQADVGKIAATKDKIKKELPDTKTIEIETNLKIATIKEQSDIIQKSLEWKAKVDIAEVEGVLDVLEQQSKNIGTLFESTGDTLSSALESMRKDKGWNREIDEQVKRESDRRDKAIQMQEDLTNAQLDYLRKKSAALSRGDALIKVDGSGLQPYLEAFMFEILKAIQVRANEEGAAFLTGI